MKKHLSYLAALVALTCLAACSDQNRVENLISQKIKSNLGNPGSYEPVEFSEPVPDSLPMDESLNETIATCRSILKDVNWQLDEAQKYESVNNKEEIDSYKRKIETWSAKLDSAVKAQAEFEKDWIQNKKYSVYSVRHKYRAENQSGGMEVYNKTYYLTTSMDSLIYCHWCPE